MRSLVALAETPPCAVASCRVVTRNLRLQMTSNTLPPGPYVFLFSSSPPLPPRPSSFPTPSPGHRTTSCLCWTATGRPAGGFQSFCEGRTPTRHRATLQGQGSVVASWLRYWAAVRSRRLRCLSVTSIVCQVLQKSHLIPLSDRDETWLMWNGDDCSTLRTILLLAT